MSGTVGEAQLSGGDALPVVPLVVGLLVLGGVAAALLAWRSAGRPRVTGAGPHGQRGRRRPTEPGDGRPGPGRSAAPGPGRLDSN
jgi:hypothetical protein